MIYHHQHINHHPPPGTVFNMAINSRPTATPTLPWLLEKQHVLIRKPAADLALQVRKHDKLKINLLLWYISTLCSFEGEAGADAV